MMLRARLATLALGFALLAGCDDGDGGGTGVGTRAQLSGRWTADGVPGRQGTNYRLELDERNGAVTGSLTYNVCGGASCFDATDALSGSFDGQANTSLTATREAGGTYPITGVLRGSSQLDLNVAGQTAVFRR